MRAERRQELRTNELAQQIDQVGDYVRKNATMLTAVVIIAAGVVGGIYWYASRQTSLKMAGWAALAQRNPPADAPVPVDAYREVAEENIDPVLSAHAWLKVGEAALAEMTKPGAAASGRDWQQIAEEAYQKVLAPGATNDLSLIGQAMIALGVLSENRSDMTKAGEWYKKLLADSRFADSPFALQAKFRLDGMAHWSSPVVFPPPPPPPVTSAPTTAPAESAAVTQPAMESPTFSITPASSPAAP
jgi:hypothetical protein